MKGQTQFVYFQLGVAISSIAFAVHQTNGKALVNTPWPIGAAVVFWAISFAFGCFGLGARQRAMISNVGFLRSQAAAGNMAAHPDIKSVLDEVEEETRKHANKPAAHFRLQLWTLFAGALFYVGGHVIQMARTPPAIPASTASESGQSRH